MSKPAGRFWLPRLVSLVLSLGLGIGAWRSLSRGWPGASFSAAPPIEERT